MWVPLPSDVVLWRLHLQLICSLSLFFCHAFSCFDNLVSWCPLVWCILVFDCNSKRYDFESSFKLVSRLNFSKNWFRTICTIYQTSSMNSVSHVVDTIENVLWSSFYCPRINLQQIYWILKQNGSFLEVHLLSMTQWLETPGLIQNCQKLPIKLLQACIADPELFAIGIGCILSGRHKALAETHKNQQINTIINS